MKFYASGQSADKIGRLPLGAVLTFEETQYNVSSKRMILPCINIHYLLGPVRGYI